MILPSMEDKNSKENARWISKTTSRLVPPDRSRLNLSTNSTKKVHPKTNPSGNLPAHRVQSNLIKKLKNSRKLNISQFLPCLCHQTSKCLLNNSQMWPLNGLPLKAAEIAKVVVLIILTTTLQLFSSLLKPSNPSPKRWGNIGALRVSTPIRSSCSNWENSMKCFMRMQLSATNT